MITVGMSGCTTEQLPEKYERLSPQSAIKSLDDGTTITGFSFDLLPAKTNYLVVTIFYIAPRSHQTRHTIKLRQGDYFPESENYVVLSIGGRPETVGKPETGLAAIVVTDAKIRHRKSGATCLLRDYELRKCVERYK